MTSLLAHVLVKTLVTLGDAYVAAGVDSAKRAASAKALEDFAATNSMPTDISLAQRITA